MTKLAILHTTPATIEPLKTLANEILPGIQVINFLDDSILPQLAENGGDLSAVRDRLFLLAHCAEQAGADILLGACSSVGEVMVAAREKVAIPVVRIDDAMAEAAVSRGGRIGVAATLATTLNPTLRLLREKAALLIEQVELQPRLVDAAYRSLMAGDREGHDRLLSAALLDLVQQVDRVVLAQASMARVLPTLPADVRDRFYTSPELAMQRVRSIVEGRRGL